MDMNAAMTGSAYDEIAERWLDHTFNQDNGVAQHQRALAFLGARESGRALHVGCGCNTRFNDLLRSHGLRLEGIDVSERMISLARTADPTVLLHHADICTWEPPHRYHVITAWDSIWHIPLSLQRSVLLKLMGLLEPGGVFIFTAGGLDDPGEHRSSAMGPEVYYCTLGIAGILDVFPSSGCTLRHLEFDHLPEKHLYVIAQKAA